MWKVDVVPRYSPIDSCEVKLEDLKRVMWFGLKMDLMFEYFLTDAYVLMREVKF